MSEPRLVDLADELASILRTIEQTHRINQLGADDHAEHSREGVYAGLAHGAREKLAELRIAIQKAGA